MDHSINRSQPQFENTWLRAIIFLPQNKSQLVSCMLTLVFSNTWFVLEETSQGTSCYPENIRSERAREILLAGLLLVMQNTCEHNSADPTGAPLLPQTLILADFCPQSPGDFDPHSSFGILITLGHSFPNSHRVHFIPLSCLPISYFRTNFTQDVKSRLSQRKVRNPVLTTFLEFSPLIYLKTEFTIHDSVIR